LRGLSGDKGVGERKVEKGRKRTEMGEESKKKDFWKERKGEHVELSKQESFGPLIAKG
jgi:hypothetical protein